MASLIDWFNKRKRRRALHNLGRTAYKQSRGMAHAKLLKDAHNRIAKQVNRLEGQIKTQQSQFEKICSISEIQLLKALERYIVYEHLTEVPGIGLKLSQTIIQYVYRDRLSDLRKASSVVPGIGKSKQLSINKWIDQYERRIPLLLKENFPGKAEVLTQVKTKTKEIDMSIAKQSHEKSLLEHRMQNAEQALRHLEAISMADFINAMLNPEATSINIDIYQRGVFAEWEPMPDWFKEIISEM